MPFYRTQHSPTARCLRMPLLLATAVLLVTGCDTSVDTFVPNDEQVYSIFGVLDVAADTQFIRVEPLADSTQVGAPSEIDATVTLEHLGAERTVTLRDSFMEISPGLSVHNFWTAEPVEPGATYRLRVARSDGVASEATATLPPRPPEIQPGKIIFPCCRPGFNEFSVDISDTDRLASMQVSYPIDGFIYTVNHFDAVTDQDDGFGVEVDYEQDLKQFAGPFGICPSGLDRSYAWVRASAAEPGFPDLRGVDLDAVARPDSFSNIENGHGFFGGVYSDTAHVPVHFITCNE